MRISFVLLILIFRPTLAVSQCNRYIYIYIHTHRVAQKMYTQFDMKNITL